MEIPIPRNVLLCPPTWFAVVDQKNAHMDPIQSPVDPEAALQQWQSLRAAYQNLTTTGLIAEVAEISAAEGLEDMVFCANQSFPWLAENGEKLVIMSQMRHPSRKAEVPHFQKWYHRRGYKILHLQHTELFEGMGDLIPIPGTRKLMGGYGFRTHPSAYTEIAQILNVEIIPVELASPLFYHLDTCFLPLDSTTALACRSAFSDAAWHQLQETFPRLIEADEAEAAKGFALNAHLIPGLANTPPTALIQSGNPITVSQLETLGCRIIELETSEFIKSGGSVFCMKMMLF